MKRVRVDLVLSVDSCYHPSPRSLRVDLTLIKLTHIINHNGVLCTPQPNWMGGQYPLDPAPEVDDDLASLFGGEEFIGDYEDDMDGLDELDSDEFDQFNAYEFFKTMGEDDLADLTLLDKNNNTSAISDKEERTSTDLLHQHMVMII